MHKILRAGLCLLLALTLVTGLCGCGGADEAAEATTPTFKLEDYTPDKSYHLTKNNDGSYSLEIANHAGKTFYSRENDRYEPTFTAVNDDILQISGPVNSNLSQKWVVFCDVKKEKVSDVFGNFLAQNGSTVARWDYLTDQHHVFVYDMFGDTNNPKSHVTLKGLTIAQDGSVIQKAEINKDGDLEVTYTTKDGQKTVKVSMA